MIPTLEDIIRGLLDGSMDPKLAARYLDEHERLQAHVDNLQVKRYEIAAVLLNVITRCNEQDRRWGDRQYTSFNAGMVSSADTSIAGLANTHGVLTPDKARWLREVRAGDDELSWMDILTCEVAKLCGKYEDRHALRDQLLDVAAVAVQWAGQLTPDPVTEVVATDNGDGTVKLVASITGYRGEETIPVADHEGPGAQADDPA